MFENDAGSARSLAKAEDRSRVCAIGAVTEGMTFSTLIMCEPWSSGTGGPPVATAAEASGPVAVS